MTQDLVPSRRIAVLTILALAASVSACTHQFYATRQRPAEVDLHEIRRIAMYGIGGDDGPPLESAITQGLVAAKKFDVLDREQFETILKRETKYITDAAVSKDLPAVAEVLPASAVIYGKVFDSKYRESVEARQGTCPTAQGTKIVMAPCIIHKRTGTTDYVADIKVVSIETGRVLASRKLESQATSSTETSNGEPPPIDANGQLNTCRVEAAQQFLHMVTPYTAQERVDLVSDGDVQELELGNRYLRVGDLPSALGMYRDAASHADARADVGPMTRAKAHYSYALGLALTGDYNTALDELKEANRLSGDSKWLEFETRIKHWQEEAERLKSQSATTGEEIAANAPSKGR